jgi:pimeloyl-ACP methyl ester carboxylesterase
MTIQKKSLFLNGADVFYEEDNPGADKNIILLHGMSFSSADWDRIEASRKITQWGYRVVEVDYPGFGRSEANPYYKIEHGNLSSGSRFVRDFIMSLDLKHSVIVGPSMGGGIALQSIIENQDLLDAAVLIAPAYGSIESSLSRIDRPVLIIWGKKDEVVPLSKGWKLHDLISGSRLVTVENAGHPVYLEKPDQFFNILKGFLDDIR